MTSDRPADGWDCRKFADCGEIAESSGSPQMLASLIFALARGSGDYFSLEPAGADARNFRFFAECGAATAWHGPRVQ